MLRVARAPVSPAVIAARLAIRHAPHELAHTAHTESEKAERRLGEAHRGELLRVAVLTDAVLRLDGLDAINRARDEPRAEAHAQVGQLFAPPQELARHQLRECRLGALIGEERSDPPGLAQLLEKRRADRLGGREPSLILLVAREQWLSRAQQARRLDGRNERLGCRRARANAPRA